MREWYPEWDLTERFRENALFEMKIGWSQCAYCGRYIENRPPDREAICENCECN